MQLTLVPQLLILQHLAKWAEGGEDQNQGVEERDDTSGAGGGDQEARSHREGKEDPTIAVGNAVKVTTKLAMIILGQHKHPTLHLYNAKLVVLILKQETLGHAKKGWHL
jgi:hypothetical protein